MATYCNITQEEIEDFLLPQGFRKMEIPNTSELVYGKRCDVHGFVYSLRVYTGINPSGESRDVGEDAMRVVLFTRNSEGLVSKVSVSRRTHRVQGWKHNLQNRIDYMLSIRPEKACPQCGMPAVLRDGPHGKFNACSGYPECRWTQKV